MFTRIDRSVFVFFCLVIILGCIRFFSGVIPKMMGYGHPLLSLGLAAVGAVLVVGGLVVLSRGMGEKN